jgi:hypothetical protein
LFIDIENNFDGVKQWAVSFPAGCRGASPPGPASGADEFGQIAQADRERRETFFPPGSVHGIPLHCKPVTIGAEENGTSGRSMGGNTFFCWNIRQFCGIVGMIWNGFGAAVRSGLHGRVAFLGTNSLSRGDDLTMIPFDLGLQLHLKPHGELNPYGLPGFSFIYADADRSDVDSSFVASLGAGIEWMPVSFLKLFEEGVHRFQELNGRQGSYIASAA